MQAKTDRDWEEKYRTGNTPWDSQLPSRELRSVLEEFQLVPSNAIELGCGTGTNAIWMAEQGMRVVGVDCSSLALAQAREKVEQRADDLAIEWIEADVIDLKHSGALFELLFDRGCYHCCRRVDRDGYLHTLKNLTDEDSRIVILCGNANDPEPGGPPKLTEEEIRADFANGFEILQLREFHFEDAGGVQGPLGWSVVLRRVSDA